MPQPFAIVLLFDSFKILLLLLLLYKHNAKEQYLITAAQAPAQPTHVTVANVSSNSVIIQWTVRLISYTPEQYMIQYGLVLNILNQTGTTVNGNRNVSVVNETQVLVVDSLLPETTYYFRVIARNALGPTQSEIGTFTTLPKQQGQRSRKVYS